MLEIIILGCGSSLGVPVIACECPVCTSESPYNKRNRSAIIIRDNATTILVDFGFEIRLQLLQAKIKKLDAAILTHYHEDHVSGIDNLRVFPFIQKKPLVVYSDADTCFVLKNRYKFLFNDEFLVAEPIQNNKIKVGDIEIEIFKQYHAPSLNSLGLKIGNFAYTNDVNRFFPETENLLFNLNHWVLDCRGISSSTYHFGLKDVLLLYKKFKPKKLYLTNMSHEIDYYEMRKELPENIIPLFDGYRIII